MSDQVQPTVSVRVEGAYENGHTYDRIVTVEEPTAWEFLDDWFNDVVWDETGDGVVEDIGSWHKAHRDRPRQAVRRRYLRVGELMNTKEIDRAERGISAAKRADLAERKARNRVRHGLCPHCGRTATKGQLCDADFARAMRRARHLEVAFL